MLISLITTLNERRREMAILRALGAQPSQIRALLLWESFLLSVGGVGLGVIISVGGVSLFKPVIESQFGLYLEGPALTSVEIFYILGAVLVGTLVGLWPAQQAVSSALKDGLSVRL